MNPTPEIILEYQNLLFSIAYQMTGEVATSEDVVQEVWASWIEKTTETVANPKAYLTRSVVNRSLNYLTEAKRQRESYRGTWLPEPLVYDVHEQTEAQLDLSYSFMLLLEKLTPTERAVFILKESFEVDYQELAEMLASNETNCRQLYHRAREKIANPKKRFAFDKKQHQQLLETFTQASETGDITDFIQLLKEDIVVYSDGGGKVSAALHPLFGKTIVEKFLRGLAQKGFPHFTLKPAIVNDSMAFLIFNRHSQQLETVFIIEAGDAGISDLYFVRNPDKLAHLNPIFRKM